MGTCNSKKSNFSQSNLSIGIGANISKVYTFGKILGSGSYGVVRKSVLKSDPSKEYAIKIFEKAYLKKKLNYFEREISILLKLDHPNIVSFIESYEDSKYFYLVMEYCSGGELLNRILQKGHLKENETAGIMQKLFRAVHYIHNKKIIHRDLKVENILFSNRSENAEIKIADFGLGKQNEKSDFNDLNVIGSKVGTPFYIAPEVFSGEYNFKCDIWSLGIIMFLLLSGKFPFSASNHVDLFKEIKKGIFNFHGKEWVLVSKNAKDLIKRLLNLNPSKRISSEEALKSPWFDKYEIFLKETNSPKRLSEDIDINILNLLSSYKNNNKLKNEVMKVFINQMTEKDIENIRNSFKILDKDNTGVITWIELLDVMKENGFEKNELEIREIIKNINPNNINSIKYSDFIAATLDSKIHFNKQKLWNIFKHFDVSNNNYITFEDLKEITARGGQKLSEEEIKLMIKQNDLTNNGKINFEEFCIMMDIEKVEENQSALI